MKNERGTEMNLRIKKIRKNRIIVSVSLGN